MEKKSFILYGSYAKQFEKLDDESAGQLIKAVFAYVNNEEIPEIKDNGADMAFSFICSQIDRDKKDYDRRCETNRTNARLGGRPKKEKPEKKPGGLSESRSTSEDNSAATEAAITTPESEQTSSRIPKKHKIEYPKEFDEFWNIYPRHDGKGDCYKKYQARRHDGYSPEELLTAAGNYRDWTQRTHKEKQYIKCGKTFLSDSMPFLDFLDIQEDIKEMAQKSTSSKNKFNNFKQREYDYDDLERKMYGGSVTRIKSEGET